MQVYRDDESVRVVLLDGSEVEVRPYRPNLYVGNVAGLADGATHLCSDGCSVTRRGIQEVWATPAKPR